MAELQSKKKSFNQAFAEASKSGLDKFQWNGGWYTTKRADESSANSHVTVGEGRDNQSSWYLPFSYKKGGKAKLISKKQ